MLTENISKVLVWVFISSANTSFYQLHTLCTTIYTIWHQYKTYYERCSEWSPLIYITIHCYNVVMIYITVIGTKLYWSLILNIRIGTCWLGSRRRCIYGCVADDGTKNKIRKSHNKLEDTLRKKAIGRYDSFV